MESEQYDQAIQDLSSCLTIQKTALEADDRLLAETHYQLGTAHLLNCAYKDAVQELRQAKTVSMGMQATRHLSIFTFTK